MFLLLLLAACGGLSGNNDIVDSDASEPADSGIEVEVVHRGGDASDGSGEVDADGDGYNSDVDCNDGYEYTYPGADEYCDDADNDCDGVVDEDAVNASTWYADADADSYGDGGNTTEACDQPTGYVDNSTDCDDGWSGTHPGADEYCDGKDNDCDGSVDEDAVDLSTWYADADSDGYGDLAVTTAACAAPSGYVETSTDCDDTVASINPGTTEVEGDGIDNDCDGVMAGEDVETGDDEITCCLGGDLGDCMMTTASCPTDYVQVTYGLTCCTDADNDGYGSADECLVTASTDCEDGYVKGDGDCDPDHYGVAPGEDDPYGDGIDQDCSGYDG